MTAPGPDDIEIVRRATLFGRLPEAALRGLFAGQAVISLARDARILAWGQPVESCYIVLGGLVKLTRADQAGDSAVIAIHGPGRPLMLAEALAGRPCSADIDAISASRLIALDAATLRARMQADRPLAMALLAAATADLRRLVAHIEELKAMTAPARLAAMILRLSEAEGGARRITLPYEKRLLASGLGMTPESFSRAMARLRELGVSVDRDEIDIESLARLRDFAYSAD